MKKTLLFLLATAITGLTAMAQQQVSESVIMKSYNGGKMIPAFDQPAHDFSSHNSFQGNKSTATGGSRWYNPYDMINTSYLSGALDQQGNNYLFYIDWDSTIRQQFKDPNTGYYYGPVNWVAIAQFVDPIYSQGFTQTEGGYSSDQDILIKGGNTYSVDSIQFRGAYVIGKGDSLTVDTMYFSVAAVPYDSFRSYTTADTPTRIYQNVTNYEGVTDNGGVMKILRLTMVDTNTRQFTFPHVVKWKVPLDRSLRKPKNSAGTFSTADFSFPVPGGLNVPAGYGFAISMAFKPGEPWVPNVDSVASHHYFMPLASQGQSGARMPYFYYTYNDRNMSYLMHYEGTNRFSSTVGIEMANTVDFDKEFLDMGGYVTCNSCWDLSVAGANKNLLTAKAYPNPAASQVVIPFNLFGNADVTVSLINTMGQTVAIQKLGNTGSSKAIFNIATLSNGIYFYTVNAGGERKTGRFVVAH